MQLSNLYNKTVLELRKAGIESAELDVQVILEDVMNKDRAFTYTHPSFLVTNSQYARFRRLIKRRKTGEPLAYILGHKEFFGLDFIVNKNVLVPRPETERLVEWGIEYIKDRSENLGQEISVCDVGTGCGNAIISIALNCKASIQFYALDNSSKALVAAKKNAQKLSAKIHFFHSNLFNNRLLKRKKFDLIIANLPYVPRSEIKSNDPISFEPHDAIFAEDNGTEIIKRFLATATEHISKDGLILIELDPRNASSIKQFALCLYKKAEIVLEKDLSNQFRYLIVKKKDTAQF